MRRRPRITNRAGTPTVERLRTARPRAALRAGRTDWYAIRNAHSPVAEILIYDEIGYWGVSAEGFVRELQGVTASAIDLRINSPGGEMFDGIAILNALRSHPATVTAYVDGLAASAASFIFQAGDRRIMRRQSQLMIHDAMGLAVGNAAEMRQMADELDRASDTIADIYAERGDGTPAKWRERMRAETWYGADDAVAAGLADEVEAAPARPDNRMPDRSGDWDLSIFAHPPTVRPEDATQAHREIVVVAPAAPAASTGEGGRGERFASPAGTDAPWMITDTLVADGDLDDTQSTGDLAWSGDLADAFRDAMRPPDESELAAAFRDALHPPGPEPEIPAIDPTEFYNAIMEAST